MKNQYFLKDKKVKIITKFENPNAMEPWEAIVYKYICNQELWAYAKQLSQDVIFASATYGVKETRLFVLNYREDLKVEDFIEYQGQFYKITRIDTKDDYKTDLFVYVADVDGSEAPNNIQPAE